MKNSDDLMDCKHGNTSRGRSPSDDSILYNEKKVFVHIVLYNSFKQHGANTLRQTVLSVLNQNDFIVGDNLILRIRDNASNDGVVKFLKNEFSNKVDVIQLDKNYGFAGGQNFGVNDFLSSDCDYFLILNPDIRLEKDALKKMIEVIESEDNIGMVCPKLLRADENLEPLMPVSFDASGMILTKSLRHFDRGSGEEDVGQFNVTEDVFGGSGACLLVKKSCVKDLLLDSNKFDEAMFKIFPQLRFERDSRSPFFDEAFFAYREDADLAWRSQLYGWRCVYVPHACGYHRRVVLPTNRESLPIELNRYSVRNRFLLQINNFSYSQSPIALLKGIVWRNLLVVLGVFIKERTSLPAFFEVCSLLKRALFRRKLIIKKAKERHGIERMRGWLG